MADHLEARASASTGFQLQRPYEVLYMMEHAKVHRPFFSALRCFGPPFSPPSCCRNQEPEATAHPSGRPRDCQNPTANRARRPWHAGCRGQSP